MDSRSVRLLLLRFLLVPVVVLSLLSAGLAYSSNKLSRLLKEVDTTDQISLRASDLLRLFADEETGVRGYLIENDSKMLEPYEHAGPAIPREFDEIISLMAADKRKLASILAVRARYEKWHSLNAQTIMPGNQKAAQQAVVVQKQGLDELRSLIDSFNREQIAARRERNTAATNWDGKANVLRVGSAALATLLILLASWATFRQLTRIYGPSWMILKRLAAVLSNASSG